MLAHNLTLKLVWPNFSLVSIFALLPPTKINPRRSKFDTPLFSTLSPDLQLETDADRERTTGGEALQNS